MSAIFLLSDFGFLQGFILISFSMLNLTYLIHTRPLLSKTQLKVEISNELIILLCAYIQTTFNNIAIDVDLKYWLGWVQVVLVGLLILGNVLYMGMGAMSDICDRIRILNLEWNAESIIVKKVKKRQEMMS